MGSVNRVFLIGRLGQDPEVRSARSGKSWCSFSLATNRPRKEAEGVWSQETDWHSIRVFGTQAESCIRFLRRGSMVSVEGAVTYDKWTDDGGTRRVQTRILADRVTFVGDVKRDAGAPVEPRAMDDGSAEHEPSVDDAPLAEA